MNNNGRLLIVSNRLPVAARIDAGQLQLVQASGGLATGLHACHERYGAIWLGWPGDVSRLTALQRDDLDRRLSERRIVPIHLSPHEVRQYYEEFSNGVLWPLCHYLLDRIPSEATNWTAYRDVNEKFASIVASHYRQGDLVWIHDYQLMLVPAFLRKLVPEARIGFFLHIPFPSSEIFRLLPWRREVLEGLLGADLVGFHTYSYLRHFSTALLHILGLESEVDIVNLDHRGIRLGVFPMGVDSQQFTRLAGEAAVAEEVAAIRQESGDRRILLGVDRLDYTKGIPLRLAAFERLLKQEPALRDRVRLIQIAVPSRATMAPYRGFRKRVEEAVGRINGSFGSVNSMPIHYLYQSVTPRRLAALYRAADVMLITALRDGMNLVAKEFVASRVDEDGVLVLSEFAGAAAELGDALVVNPYDVDGVAATLKQALTMEQPERMRRMRSLRRRVMTYDVQRWSDEFVRALTARPGNHVQPTPADILRTLEERLILAERLVVILDYDGTLVPITTVPELASPDNELLYVLEALGKRPNTAVHLVSGRGRDSMERWFGSLPISLWAEHGFWHRAGCGQPWEAAAALSPDWMSKVLPILERVAASTPGSFVEQKSASLAWHYRRAEPEFGPRQAHELRMLLGDALSNQPLEVMEGKKVIEVRLSGVNKTMVVQQALAAEPPEVGVLAIGDDRTDEDMFAALPASGVGLHVGPGSSRAAYRLANVRAVRAFLGGLAAEVGTATDRVAR